MQIVNPIYFMASSASEQDEPNPVIRLAAQVGKMWSILPTWDCLLRSARKIGDAYAIY